MNQQILHTNSPSETLEVAKSLGKKLKGQEVIELQSDIGAGKTTFVKGLMLGLDNYEDVSSPSFTICNEYKTSKFNVYHFDFYRLKSAGIMKNEIEEVLNYPDSVTVIEWSDIVHDMLPKNRLTLKIKYLDNDKRELTLNYPDKYNYLFN